MYRPQPPLMWAYKIIEQLLDNPTTMDQKEFMKSFAKFARSTPDISKNIKKYSLFTPWSYDIHDFFTENLIWYIPLYLDNYKDIWWTILNSIVLWLYKMILSCCEQLIIIDSATNSYEQYMEEIIYIVEKKNNDYSSKKDAFENFKVLSKFYNDDVFNPIVWMFFRLWDKVMRIKNIENKNHVENESLRDSYMDTIWYCLIIITYLYSVHDYDFTK